MISLYSLHLYDGNTVIGMSGYIFALFMINYYQPHSYHDIWYCCIFNIVSYVFFILLGQRISLLGHSTGIITGFLFTREFFTWIFSSRVITWIDSFLMKIFGKLSLFVELDNEKVLNTQEHVEILYEMKQDIKGVFSKCRKQSNDPILPI